MSKEAVTGRSSQERATTTTPDAVAADGDTLVFMRSTAETSFDILKLSLRNPTDMRRCGDAGVRRRGPAVTRR